MLRITQQPSLTSMDTPHCASEICLWCSAAIYSDSTWPEARSLMNFANPVLISLSFPKNVVRNRVSGLRSYLLDI